MRAARGLILRRPRLVLLLVALLLAAAVFVRVATPDHLTAGGFTDPGSESARALEQMRDVLGYDPEPGMVVLARAGGDFRTPGRRAAVADLAETIRADPAVGLVETAFGRSGLPILLSDDGRRTLLLVHFRSSDPEALAEPIERLRERLRSPGLTLEFGGFAVGFEDVVETAHADLLRAELIAFPLLALLLVFIFRGVVAAAIPLLIGATAALTSIACLRLLGGVIDISIFALTPPVFLGLGLAVDYGLLLVARYREEAVELGPGPEAVRASLSTAGRTVLFSGLAVAGAGAPLLLFPAGFLYSMGLAVVLVSVLAAAAALLVTPALLLVAGERVGVPPPRRRRSSTGKGAWERIARWSMRRPGDVALAATAILIAAAAPALLLQPTFAEVESIPEAYESRQASEEVLRDFAPNLGLPISVLGRFEGRGLPAGTVVASLAKLPGVAGLRSLPTPSANVVAVQILPEGDALSTRVQDTVRRVRDVPAPLLVGGRTAEFVDLKSSILRRGPPAFLLAALGSIAVLFALTGSLVLGVKSLLLNVLTIAAAFGVVVLIFQEGVLGLDGLLGYDGPSAVEVTSSAVIVALTFGLATDYAVLMLARITEEHEAGRPDAEAVARGLQRSGPVISSAALVIIVAQLALLSSTVFLVKQLALGQVVAIAIDVTIVRALLVPAYMRLLGAANWWAPAPLRRFRARSRRKSVRRG